MHSTFPVYADIAGAFLSWLRIPIFLRKMAVRLDVESWCRIWNPLPYTHSAHASPMHVPKMEQQQQHRNNIYIVFAHVNFRFSAYQYTASLLYNVTCIWWHKGVEPAATAQGIDSGREGLLLRQVHLTSINWWRCSHQSKRRKDSPPLSPTLRSSFLSPPSILIRSYQLHIKLAHFFLICPPAHLHQRHSFLARGNCNYNCAPRTVAYLPLKKKKNTTMFN